MTGGVSSQIATVEAVRADESLLTPLEVARSDRLVRAEDRAAYVAAHVLVRTCAADLLGVSQADVAIAQRCPSCGSDDHGRPYVVGRPDVHVSLSHTRALVAAIAAYVPCGIDVELVPETFPAGALSRRERDWVEAQASPRDAFARLWVRKEALAKAGEGSLAEPAALDVLGEDGPAERVGEYRLRESELPGAYAATAVHAP